MLITEIVNFSGDNLWLLCDSHSIDSVVEYLGRQTCTCISILNALWNYLPRPLPSTVSWDHSTFHRCVLYTTGVECHLWCCATFHTMPGSFSIIWWHMLIVTWRFCLCFAAVSVDSLQLSLAGGSCKMCNTVPAWLGWSSYWTTETVMKHTPSMKPSEHFSCGISRIRGKKRIEGSEDSTGSSNLRLAGN